MFDSFNSPNTLGIISSFPAKNGEIAVANAISRYTYLLSKSFPKNKKIVIFSEINKSNKPYLLTENILVVPSFKYDSVKFAGDTLKNVANFNFVKDILIQFEFSIFGGKKVIPSFLLLLLSLRLLNKNVSIVLHQVVTDLNELSGHLGLSRKSLSVALFNTLLTGFYWVVGYLSNQIIVHDKMLLTRLSNLVNKSKIKVIPHAVGDMSVVKINSKLETLARNGFGLAKKDKVVAIYGYRSWYKGTDWMVKTIHDLITRYPKQNLKLLVAGGVSPTLKHTSAYKTYDKKLKKIIKSANGGVRITGFIPERSVWRVFAASDVVVFPYRTRMSASGAFNLALTYKKPFLVSRAFSEGIGLKMKEMIFDLNTFRFEGKLFGLLGNAKLKARVSTITESMVIGKSWGEVASLYMTTVKSGNILVNNGDLDKNYDLVEA